MAKDADLEVRQLIERGFDHYERGRVYDALAEWESVLRLDPQHMQAGRLVDFGRQRAREIETGEHSEPAERDTLESPIPQFLAALTERRTDPALKAVGSTWEGLRLSDTFDGRETLIPQSGESRALTPGSRELPTGMDLDETWAPDTVEDLPVDVEGLRASAEQLVAECQTALDESRAGAAALAAELVLELCEHAPPPGVDDIVEPSLALFERAFRTFIGNPLACPLRAVPTESLCDHGFDERAAFLMSRMDGMTSLADLVDGSGMSPLEAVRVLAALRRAKVVDLLPPIE